MQGFYNVHRWIRKIGVAGLLAVVPAMRAAHAAPILIMQTPNSWSTTLGTGSPIAANGVEYAPVESPSPGMLIHVAGAGNVVSWQIYINRDTNWPAGATLYAKQNWTGTKGGVVGSETYVPLTTAPTPFCSGTINNNDIPIQFEIIASLACLQGTYPTTVTFTIM